MHNLQAFQKLTNIRNVYSINGLISTNDSDSPLQFYVGLLFVWPLFLQNQNCLLIKKYLFILLKPKPKISPGTDAKTKQAKQNKIFRPCSEYQFYLLKRMMKNVAAPSFAKVVSNNRLLS